MAIDLPSSGMGSKNLPVPVLPPPPPAGLGDREVSVSPKVKDGLEPIIMSLDMLNESIDTISSVVSDSDMDRLTVGELDRLLQKYFSKVALADGVALSLTRQSPPATDSSLLVRQQLKAAEINSKKQGQFEDVFSSSSKSSSKKPGMGFDEIYNKVIGVGMTATHDPLKLVDKIIPSIVGLFKKKDSSESSSSSTSKSKSGRPKDNFYGDGSGEVENDFYGSFSYQTTQAVGSTMGSVSGGRGDWPLGTLSDPIYTLAADAGLEGVSTEKDIQEEALEVGMKADESLHSTLENPEQSSFANFVGGGDGSGKKKKSGSDDSQPGIGMVLIAGMILAALILFKDIVEKVFDRVIIPFGELLIDFLTSLKEPFIAFISAIIDVAIVIFGVIKDILEAVAPFLVLMAEAIVGIVVVVLNIVKDILEAIAPLIVQLVEIVVGTVVVVLGLIKDILEAIAPHLIAIVDIMGQVGVKIAGAILDLISIITWPLRLIARILEAIEPYIIKTAHFIGGVIADWFEENEDTIKGIMDKIAELAGAITNLVTTITNKFTEFIGAFDMAALGREISGILESTLGTINDVLGNMRPAIANMSRAAGALAGSASGIAADISEAAAEGVNKTWNWFSNSWLGKKLTLDDENKARRAEARNAEEERRINEYAKEDIGLSGVLDSLSAGRESETEESILQGIWKDTTFIVNYLAESEREVMDVLRRRVSANDLIISSDGQVFETAPNDSVLAIQNGSVSMQSSSPVSGLSSSVERGAEFSQRSSSQGTTNNVYNNSNIDLTGASPFSEFCPVGV